MRHQRTRPMLLHHRRIRPTWRPCTMPNLSLLISRRRWAPTLRLGLARIHTSIRRQHPSAIHRRHIRGRPKLTHRRLLLLTWWLLLWLVCTHPTLRRMCHSWTLERTSLLLRRIHRAGVPGTIPRLSQARLRGLGGPRNDSVRLLLLLRAADRHAKPHRARTYLVLLTGTGTWATLNGMGRWSNSIGHRTSVRLHVSSSARPNPTWHITGHAVHHPPSKLLRLSLLTHRTHHLLGRGLVLLLWSSWNTRLLLR